MEAARQIWADVLSIGADEIGDTDNFFELGGDSVKAIQLLGESTAIAANLDLVTFYQNSTLEQFYKVTFGVIEEKKDTSTHYTNGTNGSSRVRHELEANALSSTLASLRIDKDSVLKVATTTPIQGFFIHLALEGDVGLLNYIYEVEGADIKNGTRELVKLLESKNPIFRISIVGVEHGAFAQLLLSRSTPSWTETSDLKAYTLGTMSEKMVLGDLPVQYCLVQNDPNHDGKSFFVISLHHAFCDAFSCFVIEKEMLNILQTPSEYAREAQRPWFGDFVNHLQTLRSDEDVAKYWHNYLEGADMANIHPLELASSSGELDGEIIETLPTSLFESRLHSNPTQFVLAAWSMALAKRSGLRDIVFGLCRHGRSHAYSDVRRMIGPLISATPFRLRLDQRHESVDDIVRRIQDEVFETAQWEQGLVPGVYPTGHDGPWVQSLVNLKSELYAMPDGYESKDENADMGCFYSPQTSARTDLTPI